MSTLPHSSGADLVLAVPLCAFAGAVALALGYAIDPGVKADEFVAIIVWASLAAFIESVVVVIPSYFVLRSIRQLGGLQCAAIGLMAGLATAEVALRFGITGRAQFAFAGLMSGFAAFAVLAQLARWRSQDVPVI